MAIPSTVCPSAACSSSSRSPIAQRPGTGSAWTEPSASGGRARSAGPSSKARSSRWASPGEARRRSAVLSAQPSATPGKASRPSRWSQSPCVASSPLGAGKRACSSSAGSASSSSGSTGESITNVSSPPRRAISAAAPRTITQLTCRTRCVATSTSRWSATARTAAALRPQVTPSSLAASRGWALRPSAFSARSRASPCCG